MSLIHKYKETFRSETKNDGYSLEEDENTLIAKKDAVYLKLEIVREAFGNSHVAFSKLTIIVGNWKNALVEKIAENKQLNELNKSDIGLFNFYPNSTGVTLDELAVKQLEQFKGLTTEICKSKDYIYFAQKGTHDLIKKDPISVQFLMGKKKLAELVETIRSINMSSGWLIQKPKGLGKDSNVKLWKRLGTLSSILIVIYLILKLIKLLS
jgi:hypothetical protein